MIDYRKRKTLKIMTGTAAAALAAHSTAINAAEFGSDGMRDSSQTIPHTFAIEIITGKTAPEDTVIFVNKTDKDLLITNFLPGLVTQNNQMLNLKAVLNKGDILLKPGYPVASKAASWQPLSLDATHSYLWCDTAVNMLPDSDTGIITLHAVVNNGYALLTAVHNEPLHNEIGFS